VRIGAIIQARMSSRRLPGKVLANVHGQPMLQYLLERVERCVELDQIVVATSTDSSDDPIESFCEERDVDCFRGPLDNVAERFREAAKRLISDQRPGHLLMCSSCLAKFTLPFFSAYSATKAAQNHFCRAMRLELARYKIEVSSVHPITTTTEFFEVSNQLSGKADNTSTVPDHASKMFVQPPERVARAIVRCLRNPRPEVWTSHIVRSVAGVMTAFPRFFDLVVRKQAKGRRDL